MEMESNMEDNMESNMESMSIWRVIWRVIWREHVEQAYAIWSLESKAAYSAWFPWYHGPYRPIVADARSPHPPRRSGVGWRGRVGERCVDFSFLPCRLVSGTRKCEKEQSDRIGPQRLTGAAASRR